MRVVLAPFGSRGDVQPLLALGLGLRDRGHEAVVAAAAGYRDWVEGSGLGFREIGGDIESMVRGRTSGAKNPLRVYRLLVASMRDEIPLCFRQTCEAVGDADLVVTTLHLAAHSASEAAGVPCRTVVYTTQLLPSRSQPPLLCPWSRSPRVVNGTLRWGTDRVFDLLFRGAVNRERARLRLAPVNAFLAHARTSRPIVACDRQISPLPADVPPGAVQTGALLPPTTGSLEPRIEAFLDAGDPPVYIGFGSTPDETPEQTSRMVAEAVRAVGRRAILDAGWSGLGECRLPPEILGVETVPHALLFPRVAAVVHHGGAGTVATAARAGVPQVVVPAIGDQFFHGGRVYDLGIGPRPIRRRRLNAARLARAIRQTVGTAAMAQRARSLAESLRDVDGVGAAIDELVERD